MSDVATFEFQASVDLYSIQQEVAKYWTGNGRNVDVYVEDPVRTFCVLEYFYGRVEEREMLCKVARYLLKVANDNCIYYYRCIDFVGFLDPKNYLNLKEVDNYELIAIDVEDLFLDAYQPMMGAGLVEKFVIGLQKNSEQIAL